MKSLVLSSHGQNHTTLVDNHFIDCHMVKANGEFVKVYLFLLRHLNSSPVALTISTIADCLDNTEKDILRALNYWEKEDCFPSNMRKAIILSVVLRFALFRHVRDPGTLVQFQLMKTHLHQKRKLLRPFRYRM